MKVAIILGPFGYVPPDATGAIEKRWYNCAVAMAKRQHEVTVYCKRAPSRSRRPATLENGVTVVGLRGYGRTGRLLGDLVFDLLYSVQALARLRRCDVLVLNTFWTPLLCRLVQWKYRVSVYNVARFPKGQHGTWRFVDRLACVSAPVAEQAVRQAPELGGKVKVIGNPIDTEVFTVRPEVTGHEARLCYAGRVHPEKGLDILVQAYVQLRKRFPALSLAIIGVTSVSEGGGGEPYARRLDRLAGEAPITWVPPIRDPSQLAGEIAKCRIFCYPSVAEQGETFGVAPLEAMALGRATIVSGLACFRDFVEDGVSGLAFDHRAPLPADRLAEKIDLLLLDRELRLRLASAGARTAHTRFTTEGIADCYLKDFSELLRARGYA